MKKLKKSLFFFFLISITFGCASSKVIIDDRGVNMAQYERDLNDCKRIADQAETGKTIGKSALFGAAVVGGINAILGGDVGRGAAVGGAQGAAGGALAGDHEEIRILKNCIKSRGYKVLN